MIEFLKGTVTPKDWAINGAIVGGAVALCVAFVFLVVIPKQGTLAKLVEERQTVQDSLDLAKDTKSKMTELEDKAARMEELVAGFDERLPKAQEIPVLLGTFEQIGDACDLRIEAESKERQSDARKETMPYTIRAHGNFHQIVQFINKLERYKRYFKISDLEIGEQQAGVSEAKFTLSTYRFIESTQDEEEEDETS